MRIVHLCLGNGYIDGYNYQENELTRINKEQGNDVYILASTETFVDNIKLGYVKPSSYRNENNIPVKRLAYKKIINQFLTVKLRFYKNLFEELEKIKPEIIFMHNICFGSVVDVVKYKKKYPGVYLYADTHVAYYNSGKNWLSLNLLHRVYYRRMIQKAVPFLERYFYIGASEKQFSMEVYKVPESIMEYFPLGGVLPGIEEYESSRKKKRDELGLNDELLFVHTGKLDVAKKTKLLLDAFYGVKDLKAKLVIIGSIPEERERKIEELIQRDKRVEYLGWKNSKELSEYLCACDLYCQPGSVSATLQNAICNFCPVLAYPFQSYLDIDCGNFIWVKNYKDLVKTFEDLRDKKILLDELKKNTVRCAEDILDYRRLAQKYCKE